ncbi:four-carbon acid sugar kinase family protein [Lyngbya confervoides]|uniref:Four-carbon acid sugar kinase family protein n=1 Tax=Lyngbya confervoides BDU141951 TaxID=1574623 RepID=A0ABD4T1D2_9CYAN|nr:four-carbon acid sugar kinase family protein [Lyngbya confervoides]MCM1982387.1 four-carbon acid sugar kinase family protein [Lyngbya confervoides BDU141951]
MTKATPKIIVLDDDPTGSQTVHSCLLLTQWDVETLRLGLRDDAPIFFILTNTRSLPAGEAAQVTREVCQHLKQALAAEQVAEYLVVSRSDSTLRGHYPVETDVIAQELGPFDAHFLTPAFFEGGRFTRDSIHYLMVDGIPTPVHETEFAQDSVFGYRFSYLPDYVAQKTQGRIAPDQVERFLLSEIRQGCLDRLMQLQGNPCAAVDAETQSDLDRFAQDLLTAAGRGKKFLFRSAASLLTALAQLPPQPVAPEKMATYVRQGKPGAFIVGSHVRKTTEQLRALLAVAGVRGIELDLEQMRADSTATAKLREAAIAQVQQVFEAGQTPVVYTSRQELSFADEETRLAFGSQVSALLMDIVRALPSEIGYLVSKGGITSNDVLSQGLALPTARLLGQIIPGCSVVRTPTNHPQFPNLPVVLFPGNVGSVDSLVTVLQRFSNPPG